MHRVVDTFILVSGGIPKFMAAASAAATAFVPAAARLGLWLRPVGAEHAQGMVRAAATAAAIPSLLPATCSANLPRAVQVG